MGDTNWRQIELSRGTYWAIISFLLAAKVGIDYVSISNIVHHAPSSVDRLYSLIDVLIGAAVVSRLQDAGFRSKVGGFIGFVLVTGLAFAVEILPLMRLDAIELHQGRAGSIAELYDFVSIGVICALIAGVVIAGIQSSKPRLPV